MARPGLGAVAVGLAALAVPRGATAAEVTIAYGAIERVLVAGVFTQGGRYYLEGAPESSCRFAFVQEPKLSASGGRLVVRLVFSGRAGVEVKGRCIGPGDTLQLAVSGVPVYSDGEILLSQLEVAAPESRYFSAVRGLVQSQLAQRLRYPLRAELERALAIVGGPAAVVRPTLAAFEVRSLRVEPQQLRVAFDGSLDVK